MRPRSLAAGGDEAKLAGDSLQSWAVTAAPSWVGSGSLNNVLMNRLPVFPQREDQGPRLGLFPSIQALGRYRVMVNPGGLPGGDRLMLEAQGPPSDRSVSLSPSALVRNVEPGPLSRGADRAS